MSKQIIRCAGCFKEITYNDEDRLVVESLCRDCIKHICHTDVSWIYDEDDTDIDNNKNNK